MCGRATLVTDIEEIAEIFGADPHVIDAAGPPPAGTPALGAPRYNVAPGQPVLVVRLASADQRELALVKGGLVPRWAREAKMGNKFVQARAETVETSGAYRDAFKSRRCLFVVDGFYEWSTSGTGKKATRVPHHVHRSDGKPFAIAAVWDRWRTPEGARLESCAVVTTEARGALHGLHDRMPLVLGEREQARWLAGAEDAHAIVAAAPEIVAPRADELVAVPVSTWVNDVKHEDARCIEPLA